MTPPHFHRIAPAIAASPERLVLAIGNFDGVHLGHQALLHTAKNVAQQCDAVPAVLTFYPHPRRYFKPGMPALKLLTLAQKIRLLQTFGAAQVIVARFNAAFASMLAHEFIEDFCVRTLGAVHIVTGDNFCFGKNRRGDAQTLAATMHALGLGYTSVAAVYDAAGEVISSTLIRSILHAGDMSRVHALLGHPYTISGRVIHGDHRGRELGFPTANIAVAHLAYPRFGVYAAELHVGGQSFQAVANLGIRPSVSGSDSPLLEVHIPGEILDLYGSKVSVTLKQFMRPEQKFATLAELTQQIQRDVAFLQMQRGDLPVDFSTEKY